MSGLNLNPGEVLLFQNDRAGDRRPDWKGTVCLPDGTKLDIALWARTSRAGKLMLSGKLEAPRGDASEPQPRSPPAPPPPAPRQEIDDDAPF